MKRRLQDELTARAQQLEREAEACRRTRSFDDDVKLALSFGSEFRTGGFDPASFSNAEFFSVLTDQERGRSSQRDHLRTQQPEFAVADNGNAVVAVDCHAF